MKLALIGQAGAGRTAVERIIARDYTGVRTIAFADALKTMLAKVGVPYDVLHGTQEQKNTPLPDFNGASARQLMQSLGDWGRGIHPALWINVLLRTVREVRADVWVVTDCRYQNEAEALRREGFKLIRILRPVDPRGSDNHATRFHSSETDQLGIDADYTIVNDGSLEDLRTRVRNILMQVDADVF